jgi:hypothetical protein
MMYLSISWVSGTQQFTQTEGRCRLQTLVNLIRVIGMRRAVEAETENRGRQGEVREWECVWGRGELSRREHTLLQGFVGRESSRSQRLW